MSGYGYHRDSATTTRIFGQQDHKLVGTTTDCVSCVRFSPKECPSTILGVTSWDCTASVWQVANGPGGVQSQPSWTTQVEAPPLCMTFSHDGRAFVGGCSKNVSMWDLQSNQKSIVASHDLPVSCVDFVTMPNMASQVLVTGSWDGKVRWWDLRSPNPIKEENLGQPIFDLDAQRTVPMMAVATGRLVHIYDMNTMTKVNELAPPDPVKFNLRKVSCTGDFAGAAYGGVEGRVTFARLDKEPGCTFRAHKVLRNSVNYLFQTNFCVSHPLKTLIFTGGGDGGLVCVDRLARKQLELIECKEKFQNEEIPISGGDLSADGTLIAYAHSYDWAAGKAGYKNQPTSVHIRQITAP